MKTAICAIARKENTYVNEWVNYHLNLGFDKIYLYDNNDEDYPDVSECIDKKDKVVVIKWNVDPNRFINQTTSYTDFIEKYSSQYDWCTFIDIDEFIHLDVPTIQDFLNKAPNNDNIALAWRVYGDDDIIESDESIPVRERFKIQKITMDFSIYKTIVNLKKHSDYRVCSMHYIANDDMEESVPYMDSNFNRIKCDVAGRIICSYNDVIKNNCYIEHYQTKSLSEFMKYKFDLSQQYATLDYYFRINDRTPEKEAYIENYLKEYNIQITNLKNIEL